MKAEDLFQNRERYFILKGHEIVVEPDFMKWAQRIENDQSRLVDVTYVTNRVRVSTVFLGLNHNWGDGPPILFETMVFRKIEPGKANILNFETLDQYTMRYQTFDQARRFHYICVSLIEKSLWQKLRKSKKSIQRFRAKWDYHAP